MPVPTPPNGLPEFALPVGNGRGLVALDPWTTNLYRSDGHTAITRAPRIRLRRAGRPGRAPEYPKVDGADRVQGVAGTVTGVPAGGQILVATQRTRHGVATGVPATAIVDARGVFRTPVELRRGDRFVRAWYAGVVLPDRTVPAAAGTAIAVPGR